MGRPSLAGSATWTRGSAANTAVTIPFAHTPPRKAHPDLKQPRLSESQLGDAHYTCRPGRQRGARLLVIPFQSLRAASAHLCGAGTPHMEEHTL